MLGGIKRKTSNLETIGLILILLLASFTALTSAEKHYQSKISVSYSFVNPIIEQIEINSQVFDRITIEGAVNSGGFGEPNLPVKGAYILLPYNTKPQNIIAHAGEKKLIGSNLFIDPVLQQQPLSEIQDEPTPILGSVYKYQQDFPGKLFSEVGVYSFRGYQILVLSLHPVQYNPSTKELYYYDKLSINVELEKDEKSQSLLRDIDEDYFELLKKVDNPKVISTYVSQSKKQVTTEMYDYLIITDYGFKNRFLELKKVYDSLGIPTLVKSLDEIGAYTPDEIRDYIREAYLEYGIRYVLLGGDDDIVPAQMLWIETWSEDEWPNPYRLWMPSDIFYGCLDGPYNYDEDNKWGERNDGEDGGDVDLLAEVSIGRACVGTHEEVTYFLNKTIGFIDTDPDDPYLKEVLLVGEYLWSGPDTWGGDYMDELVDITDTHGYVTTGISTIDYNINSLYDRDWVNNDWPKSEVISRINDKKFIVNHLGHGMSSYGLKMNSDDTFLLNNNQHCLVYSQTCTAGHFDGMDCFAEHLHIKSEYGAVAVIMNTRYGWGSRGSTDGASQRFNREFWDAIYGENIREFGRANQDSKEDNLWRVNDPCMRWCYYEITYFGDPLLDYPKPRPLIDIQDVECGFGVKVDISNTGNAATTDLFWSISFDDGYGLIFKPEDRLIMGTIDSLEPDSIKTVDSGFVFGFGTVSITIKAGFETVSLDGFIIGPFIFEK